MLKPHIWRDREGWCWSVKNGDGALVGSGARLLTYGLAKQAAGRARRAADETAEHVGSALHEAIVSNLQPETTNDQP